MSNIFDIREGWNKAINQAGDLDAQSLFDLVESMGDTTPEKVAEMVAVIQAIEGNKAMAVEYKKRLDQKIEKMTETVEHIRAYILEGVQEIGEPREGSEELLTLRVDGMPWVQSVWTEYTAPKIEVVDERSIDQEFQIPQPPKVDTKEISNRWLQLKTEYEEGRRAKMIELKDQAIAEEITDAEARQALYEWDRDNKPEIEGVSIKREIGVNFR